MRKGSRHSKQSIRLMRESHQRRVERGRQEVIEFGQTIIKKVRAYRRAIGITMPMAAELAGMKPSQWSDFENGYKNDVSLFVFVRMCMALGVKVSYFVPTKRFTRKPRATKEILKRRERYNKRSRDLNAVRIPEWKYYQKEIIAMRKQGMSLPAIKKALGFASDKTVQMALSKEFRERMRDYNIQRHRAAYDRRRVNR